MICERAKQLRIQDLPSPPPDTLHHGGQPISTTSTPCGFGGRRYWFLCPDCGRRCAILYPVRCRLCAKARYATEHKSQSSRKIAKAHKIRERLGQTEGGLLAPFPGKPKGMHWRTYERIRQDAMALEREIWMDTANWMEATYGFRPGSRKLV